jgi:oxygen-dependent protoporphyrinogen oxidase
MVVNIWYPTPQANFPHNGFGYLLPQALDYSQNPESILGVIFDSDREYPLPTESNPDPPSRGADFHHGTKLTVLMGGHYWYTLPRSYLPTTQEARKMALAAVERHLNLSPDLTAQATTTATLCRNCLPQHTVGHAARMKAAHAELEWGFKGRLAVAGQSYQTPGVLGALRAGRDVAWQVAGEHRKHVPGSDESREEAEGEGAERWVPGETGLERFTRMPRYMSMDRQMLPLRYGSSAWVDESGELQLGGRGEEEER